MIDFNLRSRNGSVATGLVAMVCMGVWLFFRRERNGEKSLFLKMIDPFDEDIEQHSWAPPLLLSGKDGFSTGHPPTQSHSMDVARKSIWLTPLSQTKNLLIEPTRTFSMKFRDAKVSDQTEPLRPNSEQLGEKFGADVSRNTSFGNILVLDDDPEIRKFIRIICEPLGCEVQEAEDGAQAIKALTSGEENSKSIDAIITDISMPKITGLEAIAYFQKEFPSIPLIVLTGIADLELAISFIGGGISNYLVKPVEEEQLKASVSGAIRHRQLTYA